MHLEATLDFLWAIVMVVLQVFGIVPMDVPSAPSPSLPVETGDSVHPDTGGNDTTATIAPTGASSTTMPRPTPPIVSTPPPSVPTRVQVHRNTSMPVWPATAHAPHGPTLAPAASVRTASPTATTTGAPVVPLAPTQTSSAGSSSVGIDSFVLVYAPTNAELLELQDGDVIDLQALDVSSLALNVKVNPSDGVESVWFAETGRHESTLPFAFCGDNAGVYNSCTEIRAGPNTITVTPFSSFSSASSNTTGGGVPRPPVTISFEIIGVTTAGVVEEGAVSQAPSPEEMVNEQQGVSQPSTGEMAHAGTTTNVGKWCEISANADIEARHEACFVMVTHPTVGRRAILIGGRGTKRTDVMDPVSRTWTSGPPPPVQLHHMQCVEAQGKVWIMAAWTDWYPKENNAAHVYVYDPSTMEWTTRTAMPEHRRRGSAAVIVSPDQRTIWVSHGNSGGKTATNARWKPKPWDI
jgi:hypothetical protein